MTSAAATPQTLALSDSTIKSLRKALTAVSFCHSSAPESATAMRWQTVWVGKGEGTEGTFGILSPRQTGKSTEYLADFFNQDQKQTWPVEFDHEFIEAESAGRPLYCHTLSIKAENFILEGINRESTQARYCLFARNQGGRITSLIQFTLGLTPFEGAFGNYDPSNELTDVDDISSLYLHIDLDLIYTRTRFRGRGAGVALLSAMLKVIETEILHISEQLSPVAIETGVQFKLQPSVTTRLSSRTGELAHNKLMEGLHLLQEFQVDMLTEQPARNAVAVLSAEDDETGY